MGLDAVVYKRLEEIPLPGNINLDMLRVEKLTGEVYLDNDESPLKKDDVEATHRRLGNISSVAVLSDQIRLSLGENAPESLLLNRVLYSPTHAGDVVPNNDLASLKQEIALIRGIGAERISPELRSFLGDMEDLISASERHGNPIVFV